MKYTPLFIAALILVSGFIAYFGDLLGRRMGKKRLTLWKLRPRHTAIIVTTITGMLISGLVLLVLTLVSSQFREVLLRGEAMQAQNRHLTRSNINLETRNKRLVEQRANLNEQVYTLAGQVSKARREIALARNSRDKALKDVSRLEKTISDRQRELEKLTRRAQDAERDLASVGRELQGVRGDLGKANSRLDEARSRLREAEAQMADAQEELGRTNARLVQAEADLKTKESELAKRRQELVQLSQFTEEYVKHFPPALRERGFILRQGDELARAAITPGQSEFGIAGELYNVLEHASEIAQEHGAMVADTNGRAVSLIFRQLLPDKIVYEPVEEQCIAMAADAINESPEQILVQVVCARNALPGEQVRVEFQMYVNRIVYHRGDRIAQTTIDGRLSEGRVLISLIDFLQEKLSRSAVQDGLIPVAALSPRPRAAQNPEEVDEEMALVERVKAVQGMAGVAVYAAADVRRGDALNWRNMRFTVSEEPR